MRQNYQGILLKQDQELEQKFQLEQVLKKSGSYLPVSEAPTNKKLKKFLKESD